MAAQMVMTAFLDATASWPWDCAGGNGLDAFAVKWIRARTVAVVVSVAGDVRSFAGDLVTRTIWRPCSRAESFKFNFFGYGYAVLGDGGRTEFLFSMTTLRPLGPRVTFTSRLPEG